MFTGDCKKSKKSTLHWPVEKESMISLVIVPHALKTSFCQLLNGYYLF